jgi:hypothetical protein
VSADKPRRKPAERAGREIADRENEIVRREIETEREREDER